MNTSWHGRHLISAPHRLAFFLAVVVLVGASAWWALVQCDRVWGGVGLMYAVSPTLMHSVAMTFGFFPLLFAGFLFTAGPKWLGMHPLATLRLLPPLCLQAVGWLVWLVGGHTGVEVALAGAGLALAGLLWVQVLFLGLIRRSVVPDQLHARVIGMAGLLGVAALAAMMVSLMLDEQGLARQWVLTALWGFVVSTFVAVAHRMIPFFTASAVPAARTWRPNWLMGVMLMAVGMEILLIWLEWFGTGAGAGVRVWMLSRGLLELAVGSVIVWLAFVWGMVQSLKIRLLAMLHIGFVWLGLSFLLAGLSQLLGFHAGMPVLGLGALHALTMGFLGSTMVAMVTRVSSGHSGRPLAADNLVWMSFWVLQITVVLRMGAALPEAPRWALALVALLWLAAVLAWGGRMLGWYGRVRADGQPG